MKRGILGAFILLLLINGVFALSTSLKQTYEPGETIIIEIAGSVLEPILPEQIEFKRINVVVPVDYGLEKINNKYYLWAVAPANENNYTLLIKDVYTTINGKSEKIDYMQNFSTRGNLTDYSIKPGVIYATDNFEISAQLNGDFSKIIDVDFPSKRTVTLEPGTNTIKFDITDIDDKQFLTIKVGKYSVIAYIIGEDEETNVNSLVFEPSSIKESLKEGQSKQYIITLTNLGDSDLKNVKIDSDFFDINDEVNINAGKSYNFNISLKNVTKSFSDTIYAKSGNFSDELNVVINIVKPQIIDYRNNTNKSKLYYCSELAGDICSAGQTCNGEYITTYDGSCCIGQCTSGNSSGSSWIGYFIGLIVLLVIGIIIIKYKGIKQDKDVLNKRVKEVEKKNMP